MPRISMVSPSITVACPMIGSAAPPADEKIVSVNDALTSSLHVRLMSNVVVTPEFLNLEAPRLARAILEHVIAHADIVGEDPAGSPIMRFEFVCPPWLMDKLAAYGAAGEDIEPEPKDSASNGLAISLCR
jgi:hypothetical protein